MIVSTVTLTQHDSRLLSSAILYLLGIVGSGDKGADVVQALDTKGLRMITDATKMLAVSAEGLKDTDAAAPSSKKFMDNLDRLQELGLVLMGNKPVEVTPVTSAQKIDLDGKATGPKQYQLWLTHEQIHLVCGAVTFAEGGLARDPMAMLKALEMYDSYRGPVSEDFVTKFNQVHEAARKDGEPVSTSENDEPTEE